MIREIIQALQRLFTWWVVVAPWEQSIRVRCGRWVRLLPAGMYLRIPFTDRFYTQTTRRRLCLLRAQCLTTADGKVVTISGMIGYEIADMLTLYQKLHSPEDTIDGIVSGMIASHITTHPIAECTPKLLEKAVSDGVRLEEFGLRAQEFSIVNFCVVRTLRVITGDFPQWARTSGLFMEGGPMPGAQG